jgi:hypothetical protein
MKTFHVFVEIIETFFLFLCLKVKFGQKYFSFFEKQYYSVDCLSKLSGGELLEI